MSATDVRRSRKDTPRGEDAQRFAERARRARRRRWVRRLLLLTVLGAVVGGVWAVGWSTALGVRRVSVGGEHRTSAATIRAAARVPIDRPMARVDMQAIAHRVAGLPTVAHVDVTRAWPHTMRIVVRERVPVAVVRRGSARRYVAADGVDFAPAPDRTPYPLLDVDVALVSRGSLLAGIAVVGHLPSPLTRRLSSVEVLDPTDVRLHLTDGTTVHWGGAERPEDKAEVLRALQRLNPSAKTFDVSAPDAPTVRF
jgi:cell division protein FtsQ